MTESVPPDLARIAFVSRRFNELKGLPTVIAGVALLLTLLLGRLAGGDPASVLSAVFVAIMAGTNVFDLKYRRAFGNPVSESPRQIAGVLFTSLPLMMMSGALWDRMAKSLTGPSGAAVAVACASLLVLARDVRWRPHYAVPFTCAVFGIVITTGTPAGDAARTWERDPHRAAVFFVTYTAIGLSIVVAGLLDHRLLTSLFAKRASALPAPGVQTRPPSRWMHFALFASVSFALAAALLPAIAGGVALAAPLVLAMFLSMTLMEPAPVPSAVLGLHRPAESEAPESGEITLPSLATLAPVLVLATATAADAMRPASPPVFLEAAFAACAAWIAFTWPRRRHYLVGVAASAAAFFLGAGLHPLQALSLFLAAAAAAIALVLFIDREFGR